MKGFLSMWEWLLKDARPLDFFIVAGLCLIEWQVQFIRSWILKGGCNSGKIRKDRSAQKRKT